MHYLQLSILAVAEDIKARNSRRLRKAQKRFSSGAMGRIVTVTFPDSTIQHTKYNAMGLVWKQWGAQTYPLRYTYDEQGRMTGMTTFRSITNNTEPGDTQAGDDTTWVYATDTGRLWKKTDAQSKTVEYTYSPSGRLIGRKWARTSGGNPITTTYTYYDSTGELRTVDYSDSTPDVLYTYTRLGMLETATDGPLDGSGAIPAPRFTYTYVYDAANPFRQASEAVAGIHHQDKLLTRTYQTASDTAQNTVAGRYAGFTVGINGTPAQDYSVSYGFDDAGRLGTVNDGETFTYGYLANSSLVQTLTSPLHVATRTYEANRDVLASISNDLPTGKTYQHLPARRGSFEWTDPNFGVWVCREFARSAHGLDQAGRRLCLQPL